MNGKKKDEQAVSMSLSGFDGMMLGIAHAIQETHGNKGYYGKITVELVIQNGIITTQRLHSAESLGFDDVNLDTETEEDNR